MDIRSTPDLLGALRLQSQIVSLRSALDIAGRELTTGITADMVGRTGGDLTAVFGIDAELARLEATGRDLGVAAARASSAQTVLGVVNDAAGDLGLRLLGAVTSQDDLSIPVFTGEAASVLETTIASINVQFGDRALFGGAAVDRVPLASPQLLLSEISAIIAAAPDAATAVSGIDAYFDTPGGGFETNIYQGAALDAPGAAREDGSRISYLVRADTAAIRETLKSLVMAAVSDDASFAADPLERRAFLTAAAEGMVAGRDAITGLRARIGAAESQISTARDRVQVQTLALGVARSEVVGVDQYDAAARFAELEGQLQSLFLVTGRLSSLSLTTFIR